MDIRSGAYGEIVIQVDVLGIEVADNIVEMQTYKRAERSILRTCHNSEIVTETVIGLYLEDIAVLGIVETFAHIGNFHRIVRVLFDLQIGGVFITSRKHGRYGHQHRN